MSDDRSYLEHARSYLIQEADSIREMADRLGESFDRAVNILNATEGKVIVTGMGKAGAVGRKIAATLSSTGTPSVFLHPPRGCGGLWLNSG